MNTIKKEIVCLQCPFACRVEVVVDEDNKIISIENNKCARGEIYVRQEVINPVRVLTSTVSILSCDEEHPLLPVQTSEAVPKGMLKDMMKELANIVVKPPVRYKDVIVSNILNTGIDVIATSEVLK